MRHTPITTLVLLLAACGGGGGDGGNSGFIPPTDAFDARAAWQNLLTTTRGWTNITGRANDGHVYVVSVQVAPAAAAPFPLTGVTANRSVQTVTSSIDGGAAAVAVNELFVDAGSLWQGSRHSIDGGTPNCDEATAGTAQLPPAAVSFAGSTRVAGPLLVGTVYGNCLNRTDPRGSATAGWSIEFEAGVTYFCLTTTTALTAGGSTTESDCIEVAPDGTLGTRARITLTSGNFTLVARN